MPTQFFRWFTLSLLVLLLAPSCRKADSDPWFTLRSRKARVVGEWTVERYSEDVFLGRNDSVIHVIIDADEDKYSYWNTDPTKTFEAVVDQYSYTFEKDGNYTITQTIRELIDSTSYNRVQNIIRGEWEFLDESGDFENKERILLMAASASRSEELVSNGFPLSTTESAEEYPAGSNVLVMQLLELRNKKLRARWELINEVETSVSLLGFFEEPPTKNGRVELDLKQ